MPALPRTPCRKCRVSHTNSNGYCDKHQDCVVTVGWAKGQKGKTTTERGYGHAWRVKCDAIKVRDKYLCVPCYKNGLIVPMFAVDHVVPKAEGGTDDDSNLQCICKDCHKVKTQQESIRAGGNKKSEALG